MTESRSTAPVPLLLLLMALAFAGFAVRIEQSTPVPADAEAGPEVFSAARARAQLRYLLGNEQPHPVGSPANARVRHRLISTLERLGREVTVQRTVGCGFGRCGRVANVLAAMPGEQPSTLLLMAHYDSVPAAPGAGDDGAGVAALLETARILQAGAPHRNSILFAFTDGEEPGLLGAEALFREHPWSDRIEAVINLEGSGSSGPSNLLRVGPNSGALVRAFRAESRFPVGASIMQAVFELMPNNTDFLHAMRSGLPGIDFAFVGQRLHYHTPLDSIANLDPGTLQHHGDNVLPLARRLAGADLSVRADNFTFVTVANRWWISWPLSASVPLAIAALALFAATGLLVRRELGWRQLMGGASGALAVVVAVVAVELTAWAIIDRLVGTRAAWPAHPWPWRLVLLCGSAGAAVAVGSVLASRLTFWGAQLGGWLIWGLLALAVAWFAPLAANVLLVPALFAGLISFALAWPGMRARSWLRCLGATLCVASAGYWMISVSWSSEVTGGFADPALLYGPLALLGMTFVPLITATRAAGTVAGLSLLAVVVGIVSAPLVPLYSSEHPQHLNVRYVADSDRREAWWQLESPDAIPPRLRTLDRWMPRPAPGYADSDLPSTPAPYVDAPAPALKVLTDRIEDGERRLSLLLRSARRAPVITLSLPEQARVVAAAWQGRTVEVPLGNGPYLFSFYDPPPGGVRLDLTMAADSRTDGSVLHDLSHVLPPGAEELVRVRGDTGVPFQRGDVWIVTAAPLAGPAHARR